MALLLLYKHREAQRSPQRRVRTMKTIAELEKELLTARAAMIAAQDRDAPQAAIRGHKENVAQIRAELAKAKVNV